MDRSSRAKAAHCRHVDDHGPGIRRVRAGKSFRYLSVRGRPIRDAATLARIRALTIPPAWTDVWICPSPAGHVQATGRDRRGRKQYRYHARFRELCEETKYAHMVAFAAALPRIRRRVDRDLARRGVSREKVLATVVRLLEITLIRVGNEEYARANRSYGLASLRDRHVDVRGSTLRFHFRGKSGKQHSVTVDDARLARIVQRCRDLPGEVLFQYVDDDGRRHVVEAADVNEYLRAISGADFTAKDFRTWAGTVLTARALAASVERSPKKAVVAAVKDVALRLGNTAAVCRRSYVHPAVIDTFLERGLRGWATSARPRASALSCDERKVLRILEAA